MTDQFGLAAAVAKARAGNLRALTAALRQFAAWFQAKNRRPPTNADLPPFVLEYFVEQAAPSGKRGRPKTSEWEKATYRSLYEDERAILKIAKECGGSIIDANGNRWPIDDSPSLIALDAVAEAMSRQRRKSVTSEAARDAVFPGRKKSVNKAQRHDE